MHIVAKKIAGLVILISNRMQWEKKNVTRGKEGCFIMVKGANSQGDMTITNMYAYNNKVPKFIK